LLVRRGLGVSAGASTGVVLVVRVLGGICSPICSTALSVLSRVLVLSGLILSGLILSVLILSVLVLLFLSFLCCCFLLFLRVLFFL
jgi:hypothetical protein